MEQRKWAENDIEPWPDVATARLFLESLADNKWSDHSRASLQTVDQTLLAEWLDQQGLAPLAYRRCGNAFPGLAAQLRADYFSAVARNTLHFSELSRVLSEFQASDIPVVLLKGAALAKEVYGGFALRPMSDVDLWLPAADMSEAAAIMQKLGFRARAKDDRPPALQFLSRGEIQFYSPRWTWGLVELHWSPFPGWWLRWTAVVDDDEIWERTERLVIDSARSVERPVPPTEDRAGLVRQLAAEDMVIQIAVHLAVTHQFGMAAVRGLMDVALTARVRSIEWAVVAERAQRWRVGTAVWTVLDLAERIIGLPGVDAALVSLRPSATRRVLLRLLVSPESVLAGRDVTQSRMRYLLLLLLVDRTRYAVRLLFRILWPEEDWLTARYGEDWSRRRHLWGIVRHGQV